MIVDAEGYKQNWLRHLQFWYVRKEIVNPPNTVNENLGLPKSKKTCKMDGWSKQMVFKWTQEVHSIHKQFISSKKLGIKNK